MNNRYQNTFKQLRDKNQAAFVPFVTLHDPDFERSLEIIDCMINSGADGLELGIPFSDPIADGPVIQKASIRALKSGATLARCFKIIATIRERYPDIPIGLLVYSNLVVSGGISHFYQLAAKSGVDSVLIADVPIIESMPFVSIAKANKIQPIFIATPNATQQTLAKVASLGEGYTYLLSRAGVTGTEIKAEMPIEGIVTTLKQYSAPPCLLGFGISNPDQVKQAMALGIDGVISGSAVVRRIEDNLDDQNALIQSMCSFISQMKQATHK